MLRRIVVVRHAKSDWSSGQPDHERPLNERGREEAPVLGDKLVALGWVPSVVLCSDAVRAVQTWEAIASRFGNAPRVVFDASLYLAGRKAALEALSAVGGDEGGVVALVGHNPGWEDLVSDVTRTHFEMKTAHAALLEAEASSHKVALAGTMRLVGHVRGREDD